MTYFAVGLGGALGAMLRVFLLPFLPGMILGIPAQILIINFLGCFVMGLLVHVMAFYWDASLQVRNFLISGLLGGFTTFSAFALDFGLLLEKNQYISGIFFVCIGVFTSLVGFFLGMKLVRFF